MTTVREEWDIACPECGDDTAISINANIWVDLTPDGTLESIEADRLGHEWGDESPASCGCCGWQGTVREATLKKPPVRIVCRACGSDDLVRDASARWDILNGCWDISDVQDHITCETCGAEGSDIAIEEPVTKADDLLREEYATYAAETRACGFEVMTFRDWSGERNAKAEAMDRLSAIDQDDQRYHAE